MTQAKEVTGQTCNADNLNTADAVMAPLFEGIVRKWGAPFEHEAVEGVHDLRVATRRLRSALRNLPFLRDKKPLRHLKIELARIADALGAVRDQDVAIIALEKLNNESTAENIRDGIAELTERRKAARERAQTGLLKALSAAALEDLRKFFDKAMVEAAQRKRSVDTFSAAGRAVVGKTLDEFCELSRNIYKPFNDAALHKYRIAAKRLRYSLELYSDCWGEPIEEFIEEIGEMQNFLGKLHDANVWLESIGRDLHDSKEVHPAHVWLLSEFVEKRMKNYRAALRLYSDWKESGFVERLRSIVESRRTSA